VNNVGEIIANERAVTASGEVFIQAVFWQLEFDASELVVGAGPATVLPPLGGLRSYAHAIDDFGNIGGEADVSDELSHAVLWYVDEFGNVLGMSDLGTLDKRDNKAFVVDFNTDEDGQVRQAVGSSGTLAYKGKFTPGKSWGFSGTPFLWQDGQMVGLNSLVEQWNGFQELLTVEAISEAGWVCGLGEKDGSYHSFLAVPIAN
jgi:hypothetical protein